MKKLLFILLALPLFASATTLKTGANGYVTIDGNNYNRSLISSYYQVNRHGDTTLQLLLTNGYIAGQTYSNFLNGDNGDTAFTSMLAVQTWMNSHFEYDGNVPATGSVGIAQLSATGTPSVSTYLRGDNTWAVVTSGADTATAGTGLAGGKASHSNTISMPSTGTAGTYGSATAIPVITTDALGRVTSVTNTTPLHGAVLFGFDSTAFDLGGTTDTVRNYTTGSSDSTYKLDYGYMNNKTGAVSSAVFSIVYTDIHSNVITKTLSFQKSGAPVTWVGSFIGTSGADVWNMAPVSFKAKASTQIYLVLFVNDPNLLDFGVKLLN